MSKRTFKYIYGPVLSWRLGRSLGIDLLSDQEKICTFDCVYCQLGKTKATRTRRKLYVSTKEIIAEVKQLPKIKIDYITFSGRGEPTLAINLREAIKAIKKLRPEPIAVLTNASLLGRKGVSAELAQADLVAVKLDADSAKLFQLINQPAKEIKFAAVLRTLRQFRKEYRGRLALQIMFTQKNKSRAEGIAKLARSIQPDEVQICTPRRPSLTKPLAKSTILQIKKYFVGMKVISVYALKHKKVKPISAKDTRFRRCK